MQIDQNIHDGQRLRIERESRLKNLQLLVSGGAHLDRRGRFTSAYSPGCSNPGRIYEEIGGAAFNAARAARRRGIAVRLVSVRGGDAAGEQVAVVIQIAGIEDLSGIFLDRSTPSYTAFLDADGDLIIGLADMNLYERGFLRQIRRRKIRDLAKQANAILVDANMPADAIEKLSQFASGKPFYVIGVSPAKVTRLRSVLRHISCLFMNRQEACSLAGLPLNTPSFDAARKLVSMKLKAAVITSGGAPTLFFDQASLFEIAPPVVSHIEDVTGAGDALAGTAIAGLMNGLSLGDALREGLAAAMLAIRSTKAAPDLDHAAFQAALAQIPQSRFPGQKP